MVGDALDEGGFKVATVASAEEAITLLEGKTTTYCALVTDINLHGSIDGWEIARIAREIDPVFPIVYMTGAAGAEWPSKGVPNSILLGLGRSLLLFPYARFPIGTTFPLLRGTRDTTAALARSSKAVAMYFA